MYYKNENMLKRSKCQGKVCLNCYDTVQAELGRYKRVCDKCGVEIIYKSKRGYFNAKRNNSLCRSCTRITRGLLPPSRRGVKLSDAQKKAISVSTKQRHKEQGHPMVGYVWTNAQLDAMKIRSKGINNPMYGKHHTKEARKKQSDVHKGKPVPQMTNDGLRKLRIKRIKEISDSKFNGHQIMPSFNKKSCEFFKQLNEALNINGMFATNGGSIISKNLDIFWIIMNHY